METALNSKTEQHIQQNNYAQEKAELPVTETELQLLMTWNTTQTPFRDEECIHQLFEEQVERTPDAVAVLFEDKQLTYREMNSRANQLARYLQGCRVGPEVLVGLCVERSLEMVVGLLAILKAGGAYVPLDPTYPKERLAFLVQDAQPSVLLTQQRLLPRLPPSHTAQIICLDTNWEVVSREATANIEGNVGPDNLVYVIYTSGSTGTPKGILIQHRSLVNYAQYACDKYGIQPGERVLQYEQGAQNPSGTPPTGNSYSGGYRIPIEYPPYNISEEDDANGGNTPM